MTAHSTHTTVTQQQIITLHIGRTRFSAKRAVETLQDSFLLLDVSVSVMRGKAGQIEITGKAPHVFEIGMFILEDVVLRERPVLYPLVSLSFYQNDCVEYFFLPSANYHATFRPKVELDGHPVFFIKKLSKSNSAFLRKFVSMAANPFIWCLNKIRYDVISEERSTLKDDEKLEFILFVGSNQYDIQNWHHEVCLLNNF
jgi:hypothetical protein